MKLCQRPPSWTRMLLLVLALCTLPGPAGAGDRIVARVGSNPVTHLEVLSVRSEMPDLSYDQALEFLIEQQLVLIWAGNNKVTVSDEELDSFVDSIRVRNRLSPEQFEKALADRGQTLEGLRKTLHDQLLYNRATSIGVSRKARVDDSTIAELYLEKYPEVTTYSISHILFTLDSGASEEDRDIVRQKALGVLSDIRAGTPFEEAAKQYSEDRSSSPAGGSLGTFREGELLPQLEEAVSTMKPGEVAGPVLSGAGLHLVRLDSLEKIAPPPLESVRMELEREYLSLKGDQLKDQWVAELREEIYVEIFEDR